MTTDGLMFIHNLDGIQKRLNKILKDLSELQFDDDDRYSDSLIRLKDDLVGVYESEINGLEFKH